MYSFQNTSVNVPKHMCYLTEICIFTYQNTLNYLFECVNDGLKCLIVFTQRPESSYLVLAHITSSGLYIHSSFDVGKCLCVFYVHKTYWFRLFVVNAAKIKRNIDVYAYHLPTIWLIILWFEIFNYRWISVVYFIPGYEVSWPADDDFC